MRVDIIGTGALGMLFGAALCSAGVQVRFWTRGEGQAEALRREGVRLQTAEDADILIPPGRCYVGVSSSLELYDPDEGGWPDWLFVTTKQRHMNEQLFARIKALKGPKTGIICFQNGVGHVQRLSEALGGEQVLAALTTEGARRTGYGTIVRAGKGQTRIGLPGGQPVSDCLRESAEILVGRLTAAGIPAVLSNDIDKEIFRKLLINAAINPLTAIWRVPNGELLATEMRRGLLLSLVRETLRIYDEYGIQYDPDMEEQVLGVCRSTSSNTSSMLKDVLSGEITEIDQINGYLVKLAQARGIQAPTLELVWRLVSAM
ncbi:ketopantoate reductase family protein [Paenibacillus sp. J22TS3]|uniref:ketopantoate reductase family protein n=1 Tax=Paenibacillus sp. J22TS3 TaxID=2807192 RepID=UPI001B19D029|nr:2-dehydropantoate 2-reductase [Paenibacillus sp. J22TS3]GIP20495.1 2-dehydropantoate 2-reductase [Paenibacillus sp. J22TS3]